MKTRNLAMINFKKNLLKGKVMVRYVYDDNIQQRITMTSKVIPLRRFKTYKDLLQKVYPNTFTETKIDGNPTLINRKIMDRLMCNLEHL